MKMVMDAVTKMEVWATSVARRSVPGAVATTGSQMAWSGRQSVNWKALIVTPMSTWVTMMA